MGFRLGRKLNTTILSFITTKKQRTSTSALLSCVVLFLLILKGNVAFVACADADNVFNGVDEDFAIADLSGIEGFFGGFDDGANGDFADDDFDFQFGQQIHFQFNAAVVFGAAFLQAAAEDVGDGHAADADFVHGGF